MGMVGYYLERATDLEEESNSTRGYLLDFYGDVLGGELPSEDTAWEMFLRGEFLPAAERDQGRVTPRQREVERDLWRSILDYHGAKETAELYRKRAEEHQGKLDKYTRIRQEYP
jgi:hypothetical protein